MQLAVLASGSGTLLDAMATAGLPIRIAVFDRECPAGDVARRHGIEARLVERTSFGSDFDRDAHTREVVSVLQEAGVDLVAMAGWGTILTAAAFEAFPGHIINTHPSLLPAFPGWSAVDAALEYGVKVTGCTVHVATLEVDTGPILAQAPVPVLAGDDAESLHERIKVTERQLYPETIRTILERERVT